MYEDDMIWDYASKHVRLEALCKEVMTSGLYDGRYWMAEKVLEILNSPPKTGWEDEEDDTS